MGRAHGQRHRRGNCQVLYLEPWQPICCYESRADPPKVNFIILFATMVSPKSFLAAVRHCAEALCKGTAQLTKGADQHPPDMPERDLSDSL